MKHYSEADEDVLCQAGRAAQVLAAEGPGSVTDDVEQVSCPDCVARLIADGTLLVRGVAA